MWWYSGRNNILTGPLRPGLSNRIANNGGWMLVFVSTFRGNWISLRYRHHLGEEPSHINFLKDISMNEYEKIEKGFKDYDNWRYLRYVKPLHANAYVYLENKYVANTELDDSYLMVLLGNYYLIEIPMTIVEYLSKDFPKNEPMLVNHNLPSYCHECCGAGKFDWVSDITGPSYFHSRYEFVRDKRMVLLYRKSNGEFSKTNMWAPTKINAGERICDSCLGTGINLDVDNLYPEAQQPRTLRSRLIECDIRHFI